MALLVLLTSLVSRVKYKNISRNMDKVKMQRYCTLLNLFKYISEDAIIFIRGIMKGYFFQYLEEHFVSWQWLSLSHIYIPIYEIERPGQSSVTIYFSSINWRIEYQSHRWWIHPGKVSHNDKYNRTPDSNQETRGLGPRRGMNYPTLYPPKN